MSCVISVPLVSQREQQKWTCFINNVNVAVSVMLKPKSFVSFLIKAMGIAFIDTYSILWVQSLLKQPQLNYLSAVCDVMFMWCHQWLMSTWHHIPGAPERECWQTTRSRYDWPPRQKQNNVLSKCYSSQRNLRIDHLKPSIDIKTGKQYFNRINDQSISCFIPQGEANTHPTNDTPRTGYTDSSSSSGGKHRVLCHTSCCEEENNVKVGWCMFVTVNAIRRRVIYYTIVWMCMYALSQHTWQNNDSYQTD